MKRKIHIGFYTLALMLFIPALTQAQQQVIPLTLEESIKFALENNVEAKNAKLEVMASQATINENLARGLPQINGTFDFTHNFAIPLVFLPNEGPFANPESESDVIAARFGVDFQSSLGVRMDQMIFDGSYFVGLKAAKTLKRLTDFDLEKAEIDVIENIKKAYFTVLVNDERLQIVEANLSRIDQLWKETQILYEEGFAEKLEVSRIRVQRNNLQSEYDKVVTATAISVELLKLQMGIPFEFEVRLTESLKDHNNPVLIEELLSNNGYRRVEMDQIKTNIELANLDLKNNQVQYMPTINGFLTYQRSGAALDFSNTFNSSNWFTAAFVGVNMAIPIFDGFSKRSKIQKNRVQIKQLENQAYYFDQSIDVEIFQAKKNLKNSLYALEVQSENRILALEVFEMTKIKYQEGVGSNLEVIDADSALKEAEANYFSALYDALIAKVDLEKALGIL
ncbi:Outer membrane protein TolC [Belliella buryatensis]|uniref:Outer membrane protein TolC n=1 Tax=Belliella buryatensis TaxID=1500549 RepID=A0A239C7C3_9BACT|nr:TolC family protein [Belliella buryatensis]SNS16155.1 Outer membrane protein TolC [Belliella buryatensis]